MELEGLAELIHQKNPGKYKDKLMYQLSGVLLEALAYERSEEDLIVDTLELVLGTICERRMRQVELLIIGRMNKWGNCKITEIG